MPLSSNGFVKSTPLDIRNELIDRVKKAIPEFTEQPADLQDNLIDTSVAGILKYEDMLSTLFNAFAPSSSPDDLFLKFGESVGLRMKSEFKAQTVITFTGQYGTFIPRGTVITDDKNSAEFLTQEDAIIGNLNTLDLIALSTTDKIFEPNTLTILKNDIGATLWGITNQNASLKYIAEETLQQFKSRVQAKFRSSRIGGIAYAKALLQGVAGVDPRLVAFYNREAKFVKDSDTYLIKGIEAIVGGGDDKNVALALYQSFLETQKLISTPSDDDKSRQLILVLEIFNNPITIQFTRPKLIEIGLKINVVLTNTITTPISIQNLTKDALNDYINKLIVGTPINKIALSDVFVPILLKNNIPSYLIKDVQFSYKIGTDGTFVDLVDFIPEVKYDCYTNLLSYEVTINA